LARKNRWKKSIAHVPQQIFLFDGTIAQNIAFSIAKDKINLNKEIGAAGTVATPIATLVTAEAVPGPGVTNVAVL
jgi:ABC-type protease/lipase transport system fused ATPase/permease subunit